MCILIYISGWNLCICWCGYAMLLIWNTQVEDFSLANDAYAWHIQATLTCKSSCTLTNISDKVKGKSLPSMCLE